MNRTARLGIVFVLTVVSALVGSAAAARGAEELTPEERARLDTKGKELSAESLRLYQRGDYVRATELLQESLEIRRKLYPRAKYPDGHPDLATSLSDLGTLLKLRGAQAKAEPFLREAVAMQRRLYPKEKYPDGHRDLADSLNNLGALLAARAECDKAEPFYRESLEMFRRLYPREKFPDGHMDIALGLNNLAELLGQRGEYAQAETLHRETLAMLRRLFPQEKYRDGHPYLAGSLNNLGALLERQGEYAQAEPFFHEGLAMRRRLYPREKYPGGHPELAQGLNNLGRLLQGQGEFAKAEPFLREALEMNQRLYPRAKYPDGHPELATSLNNMGSLFSARVEYDKAEPFYRESLETRRRLYPREKFPDGHPYLANSLNNLGLLLKARGEYARAEPLYRESLEMFRRLYPEGKYPHGHPDLANSLNNLGYLLWQQGEYAQAEPFFRNALAMRRRLFPPEQFPDGHPLLAQSLNNVSFLFKDRGQHAQAEPFSRDALRMYRRLALRYADLVAEAEALNYVASLPESRDSFLATTRQLPADASVYDQVWDSRAALTRLLERRHRDLLASRDDQTRDLGRQLVEARQRLAYLLLHPARDPEAHKKGVQKLTDAKEDLEKRLARRLQLGPPPSDLTPVTPRRLSELLPDGAAFVDLLRHTDTIYDPDVPGQKGKKFITRYVAFVVRRGRPPARVELKEAGPVEAAWAAWHKALTADRPDERAERQAADRFAGLVWRPLRDALPLGLRTVYLAAEGPLSRVPWAALPGREPDTVLLDECAVCLVPHGPFLLQRLREQAPTAAARDTLVAYGGVDYGQAPAAVGRPPEELRGPLLPEKQRVVWPNLPGTAREHQQVVALASKVLKDRPVVRSGQSASTGQLLEDLPRARYAHLATHGFFADPQFRSALQLDPQDFERLSRERRGGARSPLVLSGLVLAGANRQGDEAAPDHGILTAEELVGLPLEGLELAVLSACETGLGEDGGGEGAYGLQRAFHVAGCRGVVASLWKVDDQATQALMALFYRNLWERRLDAAEALRQAQLTLYRHPEAVQVARKRGADFSESDLPKVEDKPAQAPKRSPPAHWAAFTFSGVRPPATEGAPGQ